MIFCKFLEEKCIMYLQLQKKEEERKRKFILSKEKFIRQLNRYADVELSY